MTDSTYKWLAMNDKVWLKLDDYMIELPDLPLPEHARYTGPLLQGLYGRDLPCTISKRLQSLIIGTLEHNPDYFETIRQRRWYYFPQAESRTRNPRKIAKKRGRKPKGRKSKGHTEPTIVELD